MLLINEQMPNVKLAFGKKIVETDEKGQIEVKDKESIESLLASGFSEIKAGKKVATKLAPPQPEPEDEDPEEDNEELEASDEKATEEVEEPKVQTKPAAEKKAEASKDEGKKPHWQKKKS